MADSLHTPAPHIIKEAADILVLAAVFVKGTAECTKWHDKDRMAAYALLADLGKVHAALTAEALK